MLLKHLGYRVLQNVSEKIAFSAPEQFEAIYSQAPPSFSQYVRAFPTSHVAICYQTSSCIQSFQQAIELQNALCLKTDTTYSHLSPVFRLQRTETKLKHTFLSQHIFSGTIDPALVFSDTICKVLMYIRPCMRTRCAYLA